MNARVISSRLLLATLLIGAFMTLGLAVQVAPSEADVVVRDWFGNRWQGAIGTVASGVSLILGPPLPILLGVSLIAATLLRYRRGEHTRASITLRVTLVLGMSRLAAVAAKPLFSRERPRVSDGHAYPSGHVASVVSTGFAAVVLCLWLYPRLVALVRWLTVVATALIAVARVALGVHWLTDTIGAVLVVCGVGLLAGVALRLLPADRSRVVSSP